MKELFGAVALSLKILVSCSKIFGRNVSPPRGGDYCEEKMLDPWRYHASRTFFCQIYGGSIEDQWRIAWYWSCPSKQKKGEI